MMIHGLSECLALIVICITPACRESIGHLVEAIIKSSVWNSISSVLWPVHVTVKMVVSFTSFHLQWVQRCPITGALLPRVNHGIALPVLLVTPINTLISEHQGVYAKSSIQDDCRCCKFPKPVHSWHFRLVEFAYRLHCSAVDRGVG